MRKRTSTGAISSPTAAGGDVFGANATSRELVAWAYRKGMPEAHSPEASQASTSMPGNFAPGLARYNQAMNRYGDPDDNFNDSTTLPAGRWDAASASPPARLDQAQQAREAGQGHVPELSPQQSRAFEVANQHYQDSHLTHAAAVQPQGEAGHHGWTPESRIGAARARGAQKLPYGGDPTQAPDYVAPKGKGR